MTKSGSSKRSSQLDTITDEIEFIQFNRRGSNNSNSTKDFDNLKVETLTSISQEILKENGELVTYAPDGGWGWVVTAASFLSNFVLDGISLTHGVMMADVIKDSNNTLTETTYSLVGSVLLGVTLLVGPLVSILTNKYGFRPVAIAGSLIASLGIFLSWAISPTVPNFYVLFIFYGVVAGLGFGIMFQISVVIVGLYFESHRALATGIAICGTGVGTFVMAILVNKITTAYGWQYTFVIESIIILVSVLFGAAYRPLPTKIVKRESRRPSAAIPINDLHARLSITENRWKIFLRLLRNNILPLLKSPSYMLISLTGALTMIGFFAPFAFLASRAEEIGMDSDNAAFLISIIGFVNSISRIICGYLSDQPWTNNLIISNTALTVGGLATAFSPCLTQHYQLILYAIVFGISIACFACLRSILIMEFVGIEEFNDGFGLSLLFMGLATFIGNPIMGELKEQTDNYDYSFYVSGGILALSGILCYPLRYVKKWEDKNKDLHRSHSCDPNPIKEDDLCNSPSKAPMVTISLDS